MNMVVGSLKAILDLDSSRFTGQMRVAEQTLRVFDRQIGNTTAGLSQLAGVLAAGGLLSAMGYLAAQAVTAGDAMVSLDRRLRLLANTQKALLNDTREVGEITSDSYEWIVKNASATGQSLDALAKTYAQIAPAAFAYGISQEKVRDVILGTIGAAKAMGATNEEIERSFLGIRQVIGKDSLQMEELRQQLGEAMPLAFMLVAKGLTEINNETKQFGDTAQITTARLQQLIGNNEINGKLFVEAWSRATKEFKGLAVSAFFSVEGQMQRFFNTMKEGSGRFMVDSGLQRDLAGIAATAVDAVEKWWTEIKSNASNIGDAIRETTDEIVTAIAQWLDDTQDTIKNVGEKALFLVDSLVEGFKKAWSALGPDGQALGIIGALLFGSLRKFLLLLTVAGTVMRQVEKMTGMSIMQNVAKGIDAIDEAGVKRQQESRQSLLDRILTPRRVEAENRMNEANRILAEARRNNWTVANDPQRVFGQGGEVDLTNPAAVSKAVTTRLRLEQEYNAALAKETEMRNGIAELGEQLRQRIEKRGQDADSFDLSATVRDMLGIEDGQRSGETPYTGAVTSFRERLNSFRERSRQLDREIAETRFGLDPQRPDPPWVKEMGLGAGTNNTITRIYENIGKGFATDVTAKARESLTNEMRKMNRQNELGLFDPETGAQLPNGVSLRGQFANARNAQLIASIRQVTRAGFEGETTGDVTGDMERRRSFVTEMVDKLREFGASQADINRALALRNELEVSYQDKMEAFSAKDQEKQNKILDRLQKRIDGFEALREIAARAEEAAVQKEFDPQLFEANREREAAMIRFGRLPKEAAVFNISDQQRDELRIAGAVNDLLRQRAEIATRIQQFSNDAYQSAVVEITIASTLVDLNRQKLEIQGALAAFDDEQIAKLEAIVDLEQRRLNQRQTMRGLQNELTWLQSQEGRDANNAEKAIQSQIDWQKYANDASVDFGTQIEQMSVRSAETLVSNFSDAFMSIDLFAKDAAGNIGETFKTMFGNLASSFARILIEMQMRAAAVKLFNFLGLSPTGTAHTGGMVGGPLATKNVSPLVFAGAPRFHTGGLLPGEIPIIAKRGEGIFTPKQMDNADQLLKSALTYGNAGAPQQQFNITVNANGGTQEQNADLARQIAREVREQSRAAIADEIRNQKRPGGSLY